MDDIEAIKQLEQIKKLKARYMRTVDTKDWEGFRNVFTPDCVWDMRNTGSALVIGADDIVAFNQVGLADDMISIHQGHMPEIELTSPTTATGIWSSEHMHRWPDGRELHGYGHYYETYVKVDGEWKINTCRFEQSRADLTSSRRDAQIDEMLAKEAIRDALMRYCRGVDRLDADIIRSVYHPDAYDDHAGRQFTGETVGQGLVDWMTEIMDVTSHNITTSNIEIEGDSAGSEAYTTSMHLQTVDGEQRMLLAIARYVDRFERRNGEWKIIERVVVPEFTGWVEMQRLGFATPARRDKTDPSYRVLPG